MSNESVRVVEELAKEPPGLFNLRRPVVGDDILVEELVEGLPMATPFIGVSPEAELPRHITGSVVVWVNLVSGSIESCTDSSAITQGDLPEEMAERPSNSALAASYDPKTITCCPRTLRYVYSPVERMRSIHCR